MIDAMGYIGWRSEGLIDPVKFIKDFLSAPDGMDDDEALEIVYEDMYNIAYLNDLDINEDFTVTPYHS